MERPFVVDAHVHFWDPAAMHYPWLEQVPDLERAYLPPDYFLASPGAADAAVFVEANCAPAESARELRFVQRLADVETRIVGIIAFANLLDEGNRDVALDRLVAASRVVGVRHNIQGLVPGFCASNAFVRGVQEVGRRRLVFDLCATANQLPDVATLVARCPDTQFVLDHCGKPAIRDGGLERWGDELMRLSRFPNVSCKLSGLFTEARAAQRDYDSLFPYAQHALDCFGVSRLVYGSDWPVVTAAGGTSAWRDFAERFAAPWSSDDRSRFFADNAIRLYGLELHART